MKNTTESKKLSEWLLERNIDQRLKRVSEEDEQEENKQQVEKASAISPVELKRQLKIAKSLIAPFDKKVKVGQIRLLPSGLTKNTDRMVHVSIISEWDRNVSGKFWLVSIFSPYDTPATKSELIVKVGKRHFVLSLWNSSTVSNNIIKNSWIVGNLSKSDLRDSMDIFRHSMTGKEIPKRLIDRVGVPIYLPNDPRIQYQNEEVSIWKDIYGKERTK